MLCVQRILREIKLLRHFDHDNVISVLDIMGPSDFTKGFDDVYIVTDLMVSSSLAVEGI